MFQADSAGHKFEGQILICEKMQGGESFGDSSELIVSRSYGNGSHITSLVMQFKKIYGRDICDSVNVHQERGPFTLQGMLQKN